MSEVKTVSPEELREEADRLEREISIERGNRESRQFFEIRNRASGSSDLAVRLAAIGEASELARTCDQESETDLPRQILTWIEFETESIIEEGLVSEGGQS